jgi:hypothetical protein
MPEEDRVRLVELLWESLTPRDVQARGEFACFLTN